jgi:hypothetical protein
MTGREQSTTAPFAHRFGNSGPTAFANHEAEADYASRGRVSNRIHTAVEVEHEFPELRPRKRVRLNMLRVERARVRPEDMSSSCVRRQNHDARANALAAADWGLGSGVQARGSAKPRVFRENSETRASTHAKSASQQTPPPTAPPRPAVIETTSGTLSAKGITLAFDSDQCALDNSSATRTIMTSKPRTRETLRNHGPTLRRRLSYNAIQQEPESTSARRSEHP